MKNKILKGALSFCLASVLVFCSVLICYRDIQSIAYADNVTLDDILDTSFGDWSEVPADLSSLASAYFDLYMSVRTSDLSGYIKSVTDIPLSWLKFLKDGTAALSPVSGIYYTLVDGKLYENTVSGSHGGGGGRSRPATSVVVPSVDFKESVEESNTNTAPKGKDLFKQSFRTDKYIHSKLATYNITIWQDGQSALLEDLYLYPFYTNVEGDTFYTNYQYHVYWVSNDDANSDVAVCVDVYKYVDGFGYILQNDYSGILAEFTSYSKPFAIGCEYMGGDGKNFWLTYYHTAEDYSNTIFSYRRRSLQDDVLTYYDIYGNELTEYNPEMCYFHFKYSDSQVAPAPSDVGFICSTELISRQYTNIDTSKIPDNYYVTISGDTIYDYSITNPETGESDTINNYITNNYTYITNNNGGNGSGGTGGSGGNVTVGGQIDVSGTVGVDVNVNINNNGNGGVGDYGDYIDDGGADVDVGGILGKLPQLSKGFVDYLKGFFAWLPAEIYSLIILILVISVWNVFRSRR